jgi:deoxycytidylate deaminase
MRYSLMEPCSVCGKDTPVSEMTEVVVQTAKQTHSSPAEYEDRLLCQSCLEEDERDPDYERANLRFKEREGHAL